MTSLAAHQQQFWRLVTQPDADVRSAEALFTGGRASARNSLAVYRRMYLQRLGGTLDATYPATRHLLGHSRFIELGRRYLARNASRHHAVEHIGSKWPEFLDEQGEEIAAGLAALERARLEALLAPEHGSVTQLDPTELATSIFEFDAAVILLSSGIDLVGLWHQLSDAGEPDFSAIETPVPTTKSPEQATEEVLDLSAFESPDPCFALVFRRDHCVRVVPLDAFEAQAFERARAGAAFHEVCEVFAEHADATHRVAALLKRWLSWGIITTVRSQAALQPETSVAKGAASR